MSESKLNDHFKNMLIESDSNNHKLDTQHDSQSSIFEAKSKINKPCEEIKISPLKSRLGLNFLFVDTKKTQ